MLSFVEHPVLRILPVLAAGGEPADHERKASPRAPGRTLSGDRLEALLRALHDDPTEAAREYERIRQRLIRLFVWKGARFPEELADTTLDHAAAALHRSGEKIRARDKFRYCCAVAFTTLKEAIRAERREEAAEETHQEFFAVPSTRSWSDRSRALETALQELEEPHRRLILEYYRGSGGQRIRHRKRMASLLGVTPGALRLRAHKVRLRLEARVSELLADEPKGN